MIAVPKRIMHAVRIMNRGGVETWLMHAMRHLDPRRVRMDFLVHSEAQGEYDDEIRDLGGKVIRCGEPLWSIAYRHRVALALAQNGPYDVFHSHVHHFSGYLLYLARIAGIPNRIAQSHNDTSLVDRSATWLRRCYLRWASASIQRNATCLAAVSKPAGRALFGAKWQSDPRNRIQRCGIDLSPFRSRTDRVSVREEWRISDDAFVLGHVGRFDPQKNHSFVIQIVAELVRQRPNAMLLLIGDGPLRPKIEREAREAGIVDHVIFGGVRKDVPRLLQAMDLLVFPSRWEGLPLTLMEAQAAGVPSVISDVITNETDIVSSLIRRVPLSFSAAQWADEILSGAWTRAVDPEHALQEVEHSSFNISSSVEQLYAIYNA